MDQELMIREEDLRKFKIKRTLGNIGIYTFLVIFAIFIIIPFYWMFATALRTEAELQATSISFFPKEWLFSNFKSAIEYAANRGANFFKFYFNTIWVGLLTTAGTMITTILSAFAFARLNFKGKDALFSLFLATMMIPGEIFVITNYTTIASLELKNTYTALVIPFMVSVFYIYFLRQTFKQIPDELYFAAKVDGTSDFKYLWKVMIPMAKSTLTSILILSMMGTWNAYVWPNLVASDNDMLLVSNGLLSIYRDTDGTGTIISLQMAAAVLVTVPLIIVFLVLRKQIMNGVSRGGLKG